MFYFQYLRRGITYDKVNKVANFNSVCGFKRKTCTGKLTVLYGFDNRAPNQRDLSRIQRLKFARYVDGCKRKDRIRNEVIRQEFDIPSPNSVQSFPSRWVSTEWNGHSLQIDVYIPSVINIGCNRGKDRRNSQVGTIDNID